MQKDELIQLRKDLVSGKTDRLREFYNSYKSDCRNVLVSKNLANDEQCEDIFSDALIILHKNIVSGKIQELTSVRSYLISTSINLARKEIQYEANTLKKLGEIRLLFYENNDTTVEEEENKGELIKICQQAFKNLTERCQKIIEGYYIHRLSMKEIAESLGLSSGDVAKTLKSRCYKYLLAEVNKIRS